MIAILLSLLFVVSVLQVMGSVLYLVC